MIDCAIICPAYLCRPSQLGPFSQMVQSLLAQSNDSWHLFLINDGSPLPEAEAAFAGVQSVLGEKVTIIGREQNSGQGLCRNLGARLAWRAGIPYCVYLDSDDQADINRVKIVRQTFRENARADFLYSSFRLIDETGGPVTDELITPSIKEILNSHKRAPPMGRDAWKEIGVIRGYTTLTSTVSVRTWLAVAHPFPDVYVSEDQHTWLRMTATTDGVVFDNSTMSSYRVTTDGSGSSVRKRVGSNYYEQKAWVDSAGFIAAMRIALRLGKLKMTEVPELLSAFYGRSAMTLEGEDRLQAAQEYHELGRRVLNQPPEIALTCFPARSPLFVPTNEQNPLNLRYSDVLNNYYEPNRIS